MRDNADSSSATSSTGISANPSSTCARKTRPPKGCNGDHLVRRDTARATVQPHTKLQCPDGELLICICEDQDDVFAGKLHHRGRISPCESRKHFPPIHRGAGKDHIVREDGLLRTFDILGKEREQLRIEAR